MTSIPALLIRTDGTVEDIELAAGAGGTHLYSLYHAIGCDTVDVIRLDNLPGGADMWVDDEALLTEEPFNSPASCIVSGYFKMPYPIFNNAVLTGSDIDGDTQGLLPETRDWIVGMLDGQ